MSMTCSCCACLGKVPCEVVSGDDVVCVPIPNPARGGQKSDTRSATQSRKRIRGKQSGAGYRHKLPCKRTATAPGTIARPSKVVVRRRTATRRGEAYIIGANSKYVLGSSEARDKDYIANVTTINGNINTGDITTVVDAKAKLAALISC